MHPAIIKPLFAVTTFLIILTKGVRAAPLPTLMVPHAHIPQAAIAPEASVILAPRRHGPLIVSTVAAAELASELGAAATSTLTATLTTKTPVDRIEERHFGPIEQSSVPDSEANLGINFPPGEAKEAPKEKRQWVFYGPGGYQKNGEGDGERAGSEEAEEAPMEKRQWVFYGPGGYQNTGEGEGERPGSEEADG